MWLQMLSMIIIMFRCLYNYYAFGSLMLDFLLGFGYASVMLQIQTKNYYRFYKIMQNFIQYGCKRLCSKVFTTSIVSLAQLNIFGN